VAAGHAQVGFKFDSCVNAFHADTVGFLLPYVSRFDKISWWVSRTARYPTRHGISQGTVYRLSRF
jgi:hypothetical protein